MKKADLLKLSKLINESVKLEESSCEYQAKQEEIRQLVAADIGIKQCVKFDACSEKCVGVCKKDCECLRTCAQLVNDLLTKPSMLKIADLPKGIAENELFMKNVEMLQLFRIVIMGLSNGDLLFEFKEKGYIAGALKSLQASLRHLTWQTQKIADGDFSQRVDFMGGFSEAFNRMAEQLEVAMKKLEDDKEKLAILNATKDKFFSIIAHDLRGPIGSMVTMFEMLNDPEYTFEDDEFKEIIGDLAKSAAMTFSLLENLLYWARNQRGEIEVEPEEVNLYAAVQECVALLENIAKGKNIVIKNDVALTEKIVFDVKMIKTIIRNLISNALKFTYGGGTITVYALRSENENKMLKVVVNDTGIGISKEKIARMFRIDAKIVAEGTKGEKGSGLGLLLCKDFVESNGGKIWVESEEGVGSSFIFTVPALY